MNPNSREFWKDKAADYKKQLYQLIDERASFKEKLSEKIEEQKTLIKELEAIKNKLSIKENEFSELINQVKLIKEEFSREKDKKITRGQKMVLLDYFKMLEPIVSRENFSQKNKIKLLSYIIDANEKNIQGDFNARGFNQHSSLNNASNNSFLVKVFNELKMTQDAEWAQERLDKNLVA